MDGIRQYILTVVCMAIICGLIQLPFTGNSSTHAAVKLVTGLVLTVTVISPLLHLGDLQLDEFLDTISVDGQWAVTDGEQAAYSQLSKRIKEEAESYIINKADEWGTQIKADVSIGEGMPPALKQVTITGTVPPYAKKRLSLWITNDLGIAEEEQIWIS